MEEQTYKIYACNLAALDEQFRKLSKKAKKLGVEAPSYNIIRFIPEFVDRLTVPVEVIPARYEISVSGEFPKLEGWDFVGTIEHTKHGNVLRAFPGKEIPEDYRSFKPTCDHCETQRNRKDTFLVENTDGELKRVGRQCIKDYLGGKSPEQIAYSATFLKVMQELEDEMSSFRGNGFSGWDTITYLAYCIASIRHHGFYLSNTKAREEERQSTSDYAFFQMTTNESKLKEIDVSKDDIAEAYKLLEWAQNIEDKSSFHSNLKVIAHKPLIKMKDLGFVACIPTTYKRELGLIEKREAKKKEDGNSNYFGEVGKRTIFDLVFQRTVAFNGFYGRTYLYFFRNSHGDIALWKTSTPSPVIDENGDFSEFEEGKSYKLKATVKEHSVYKGTKQTVLSRAVVVE